MSALDSGRLERQRKLAKELNERGNDLASNKIANYSDGARIFFQAHNIYLSCGNWQPASECLSKCALMYKYMKKMSESGHLYVQSGDIVSKVDKSQAVRYYKQAITIFNDLRHYSLCAVLLRIIADIQFANKHWYDACEDYKVAAGHFLNDQKFVIYDVCLERIADCYIEMGELTLASETFATIAEGCSFSNLRSFNTFDYALKSVICLLGQNCVVDSRLQEKYTEKYTHIETLITALTETHPLWLVSKEYRFIISTLTYRVNFDLEGFLHNLYLWNNFHPFDARSLQFIEVVLSEIKLELSRRQQIEQRKKEKEVVLVDMEKQIRKLEELEVDEKIIDKAKSEYEKLRNEGIAIS